MQKENYNIKFIFEDGIIRELPAIIESKVFDLESNAFINLQTGKVIVLDNDDSRKITLGRRFINMG
jgi:hypothetical protein